MGHYDWLCTLSECNYVNSSNMSASSASLKNLSLDRLRNFAAVVRKGGIAEVTGDNRSKQALISRQIGELASHFEAELTRRSGRGLAFTPAGEQLARLVTEFDRGLEELRGAVKAAPVAYTIAGSNSVLHWLLIPKLEEISTALPTVRWTLRHEGTTDIGAKVAMGEADFGLCVGTPEPATLKRRLVGFVEYAVFVPPQLGSVADAASALRGCPLALPLGGTLRAALDGWAAKQRVALKLRLEVDSYLQAAHSVANGTHAAVLPSLARLSLPEEVRAIPLPAAIAQRRKLWLVWTDRLLRTRSAASGVRDTLARALAVWVPSGL
jgi:DNA-binding transcriptional LysR family regulator